MSPAIILDGIGINGEFLSDFIAEKIADIETKRLVIISGHVHQALLE